MIIPFRLLRNPTASSLVLFSTLLLCQRADAWERYLPERALYGLYQAAEEHREANRHEEARETYGEVAVRSRQWDFPAYTYRALWALGSYKHREEALEEAERLYEEALEYLREALERGDEDHKTGKWKLLMQIQSVHEGSGRLNSARQINREILEGVRGRIAADLGVEVTDSFEDHLADLMDPETLEVVGWSILKENYWRLLQGETEGALASLELFIERWEAIAGRTPALDTVLASAYSHHISLNAMMGDDSSMAETVEKQRRLEQTEGVAYFTGLDRARYAFLKFSETGEDLDEALEEARAGIRILERIGHLRATSYARAFPIMILAEAGRGEAALDLLAELLEEARQQGKSVVDRVNLHAAFVLSKSLTEPGHDSEFWKALKSVWRSGNSVAAPYTYAAYANYCFNTGSVDDAVRYAGLGLALGVMFERIGTMESLEADLEDWLESSESSAGDGAFYAVPVVVHPAAAEYTATVPESGHRTPFDFIVIQYTIPLTNGESGANVRVRTSEPVRVEFYDPETKRLIGVDSNGNGDFNGMGEVAFRDARSDGFPELPREVEAGASTLKLLIYPTAHREPDERERNSELTITLETEKNGQWQPWASTRLDFGNEN